MLDWDRQWVSSLAFDIWELGDGHLCAFVLLSVFCKGCRSLGFDHLVGLLEIFVVGISGLEADC